MQATDLRVKSEKKLFTISFIFSLIAWIGLIVSVIGLVYGIFVGLFVLAAHATMIAHLKGHGVKLSEEQLPEIYAKVVKASETLGLTETPEVYIMQAGGMLNAFATRFFGRKFVVIYSDLLEACHAERKEMDMIIGHEVGHFALGHLKWLLFLLPARILPWIGTAYSRACEYSCDRCGMEVAGDLTSASRGLVVLASGGKYAAKVNLNVYVKQVKETGGFWTSIYELNSTHPYLSKRVAELVNWKNPNSVPIPRRSFFACLLAPVFGFAAPGSGGAAPLMTVAIIGILAAIAIPQFQMYKSKAEQAKTKQQVGVFLEQFYDEALDYAQTNNAWPCDAEDFDDTSIQILEQNGWTYELSCEENYFGIIYPVGDKQHFQVVYYDDGSIDEGILEQ